MICGSHFLSGLFGSSLCYHSLEFLNSALDTILFREFISPLFPGQGPARFRPYRWGYCRIQGPYLGPILCGMMMMIGFFIHRWLERNHHWLNPRIAFLIRIGIIGGILMTMSRGPWVGAVAGLVVAAASRAKNRAVAIAVLIIIGFLVGPPSFSAFRDYVNVDHRNSYNKNRQYADFRSISKSQQNADFRSINKSQQNAAYRRELVDNYKDVVISRNMWGWGRNEYPQIKKQRSIDNHWLLLALNHGLIALGFLIIIFFYMSLRLWFHGLNVFTPQSSGSLAFTLCSIYVAIFVTITTVLVGEANPTIFFPPNRLGGGTSSIR